METGRLSTSPRAKAYAYEKIKITVFSNLIIYIKLFYDFIRLEKDRPMNDNSEIYVTCRHLPKFHRFHDTDMHGKCEKGRKRYILTVSSPTKRQKTILVIDPDKLYGQLITKRKIQRGKLSKAAKHCKRQQRTKVLPVIDENELTHFGAFAKGFKTGFISRI